MLLQSQELTNINFNISNSANKSPELNAINISKKHSEEAPHKDKSDNNSLIDAHDLSDRKKNETLEVMKTPKNLKHKLSLKNQKSIKKTNLNPLFMFDDITDSLNNIISIFLEKHSNQEKVAFFKKQNVEFKGSLTLLTVLEEFEDFNFFDMISSNEFLVQDEEKKKKLIIERNNFFLRVLSNLEELNLKVDHLVNNFVMLYTDVISEIEVDYFFLCFYDYNDMAESLVLKHNEYFKSLFNNNSNEEVKKFFKNYRPKASLLKSTNENNSNNQISDVEVNFVKSVINSCIKRNFHEGILYKNC